MTAPSRARIAVLASGGGSNLEALIAHLAALGDARAADVALVLASRADAGALARAERHDVPREALRDPSDTSALLDHLERHEISLIVLAGYLKLVPVKVVRRYHGRVLNVHPALLPAFGGAGMYGARVHEAVLASGARVSGATVHFVDDAYDKGPIVAQWPVPVFATDFPDTLAARVLRVEHVLLPRVVQAVAAGDVSLAPDGSVVGAFSDGPRDAAFALPNTAPDLGDDVERMLRSVAAPSKTSRSRTQT